MSQIIFVTTSLVIEDVLSLDEVFALLDAFYLVDVLSLADDSIDSSLAEVFSLLRVPTGVSGGVGELVYCARSWRFLMFHARLLCELAFVGILFAS